MLLPDDRARTTMKIAWRIASWLSHFDHATIKIGCRRREMEGKRKTILLLSIFVRGTTGGWLVSTCVGYPIREHGQ